MDLSVVAEGVETRQQLERLMKADCDYVQGYYFARPMPRNEFEELLRNGHTAMEQEGMGDENLRESQPFPVLLVADEDACYRRNVRETFEGSFQVMEAGDGKAALRCMADSKSRIAAVILSLTLSGTDGFSVLEYFRGKRWIRIYRSFATSSRTRQWRTGLAMELRQMILREGSPIPEEPETAGARAIHAKAPREQGEPARTDIDFGRINI